MSYLIKIVIEEITENFGIIPIKIFCENASGIEKLKKSISKGFNGVLKFIREDMDEQKIDPFLKDTKDTDGLTAEETAKAFYS